MGDFLYFLESVSLHQNIDQPIRVMVNISSLLNLILVLTKDVSLFQIMMYCFMGQQTKQKGNKGTCREFKHFNIAALRDDLDNIPWNIIYNLQDIDGKIHFLYNILLKHAPLVTRTFQNSSKPWIMDNVEILLKLRDKAYPHFGKTKKTRL